MRDRQQNSTSYPMPFFMVYSTDHQTGKPGLSPAVTISKNGAGFGAPSGAVSEIGNGWYSLAGNATDRATLGSLIIHASATGADTTDTQFRIVPWDPYDAVRMGLTALPNVASGGRGAIITQGDGTAQLNVSGGKAPATMAAADLNGGNGVALTVAQQQAIAREKYQCSGTVWHVSATGSDANDGLTWATAKATWAAADAAGVADDVVLFGAGTFTFTEACPFSPKRMRFYGAGRWVTTHTCNYQAYIDETPAISPASQSGFFDMGFTNTGAGDGPTDAVILGGTGVGVHFTGCYAAAQFSGFLGNSTWILDDCDANGAQQTIVAGIVRNCRAVAAGYPGSGCYGIQADMVENCIVTMTPTTSYVSAVGIRATVVRGCNVRVDGSGGDGSPQGIWAAYIFDTVIVTIGGPVGTPVDLAAPSVVSNCIYDATKAAGITQAPPLANLDAAVSTRLAPTTAGRTLDVAATGEAGLDVSNIKQATGATTLTNITVPTVTTLTNAPSDSAGVTTLLNRIGSFSVTGANTILGCFKAMLSKTATAPSDVGGAFDPATDSVEAIRDRGDAAWVTGGGSSAPTVEQIDARLSSTHGGGSWLTSASAGSGANTVTVTVTDGTSPIEGAAVRFFRAGESLGATTNASGVAVFGLGTYTYSLAASANGFSYTTTTGHAISADTPVSLVMTAISITPAAAPLTTVYTTVVNGAGVAQAGKVVTFTLLSSDGTTALAYDATPVSATSDADGVIFKALRRNSIFKATGPTGNTFTFGTTDDDTCPIPEFII